MSKHAGVNSGKNEYAVLNIVKHEKNKQTQSKQR